MKQIKTLLFLLLLPIAAFSQSFDIDLGKDPIENKVIQPSAYDFEAGSYAVRVLKIDQYKDYIQANAKRKVIIIFHDTAGELDHNDLKAANNAAGAIFTGEQSPKDGNGHGTHAAGCAVAYNDDFDLGTAGYLVDINMIEAIPDKVLTNAGQGSFQGVENGVSYFVEKGLEWQEQGYFVIHNLSLGGTQDYTPLANVIKKGTEAGQLFIIAAGNSGGTPVGFPGRADGAIAIAATDSGHKRAYFSSYGDEVKFGGPGVEILSTLPGGSYGKKSGTSMAAPVVAGVFANLASIHPDATSYQLVQFVADNSLDIYPDGKDEFTGFGVPVFGDWIKDDPTKYPNEPIGDEPDSPNEPDKPITREKRAINFHFDDLKMYWKNYSDTELETITVSIDVEVETDLYDLAIHNELEEDVRSFFTNRGVVLSDTKGFVDAAFYTGYFFKLILVKQMDPSYKLKILDVRSDYSGRHSHVPGKDIEKKLKLNKIINQSRGKAYSLELKP